MAFTAKDVQALRQATGAGMMDAKKALEANDGDMEASKQWLREKGLAASAKRDDRENTQGVVALVDRRQRRRDRQAEERDRLRRQQRPVQGRGRHAGQAGRRRGRGRRGRARDAARRPEDHAQGEHRARRRRSLRSRARQRARQLPAHPGRPRRQCGAGRDGQCLADAGPRRGRAHRLRPAEVPQPRRRARRRGRARAPDAGDDQPQRGQARSGAAEDHRRPSQRLLQGRRPARPAVRQGRQAVDHPGHRLGATIVRFAQVEIG